MSGLLVDIARRCDLDAAATGTCRRRQPIAAEGAILVDGLERSSANVSLVPWRQSAVPKGLLTAVFRAAQRRGGDSNPRWTKPPITVFETAAFNHSATSPGRTKHSDGRPDRRCLTRSAGPASAVARALVEWVCPEKWPSG